MGMFFRRADRLRFSGLSFIFAITGQSLVYTTHSFFRIRAKMRRFIFSFILLLLCLSSIVLARDLTFVVTSDTHFGYLSDESRNTEMITTMNNLPSMPYPPEIAGFVDEPAFVIIAGDLSDSPSSWTEPNGFLEHYGLDGTDGLINYPVYEGRGNHDTYAEMIGWITERHGGLYYSFDVDGIHFVCLDLYPTEEVADWLHDDLAGLSDSNTPIILFQHYYPSSLNEIMDVIYGYNILAVFHGHGHNSSHSVYNDPQSDAQYDIFQIGSPTKGSSNYFYVVHITNDKMTVVENYCFEPGQWRNYYIWRLCTDGSNYPKLSGQFLLGDFVCRDGVEFNDLAALCEYWLLWKLSADVVPDGGDGIVNFLDFAELANTWQSTSEDMAELAVFSEQWLRVGATPAEITPLNIAPPPDGDGIVNFIDFAIFANQWLLEE